MYSQHRQRPEDARRPRRVANENSVSTLAGVVGKAIGRIIDQNLDLDFIDQA
jgi:hypothetical protein